MADLLATSPLRFVRRTELDPQRPIPETDVLLLDTFGELARINLTAVEWRLA